MNASGMTVPNPWPSQPRASVTCFVSVVITPVDLDVVVAWLEPSAHGTESPVVLTATAGTVPPRLAGTDDEPAAVGTALVAETNREHDDGEDAQDPHHQTVGEQGERLLELLHGTIR